MNGCAKPGKGDAFKNSRCASQITDQNLTSGYRLEILGMLQNSWRNGRQQRIPTAQRDTRLTCLLQGRLDTKNILDVSSLEFHLKDPSFRRFQTNTPSSL